MLKSFLEAGLYTSYGVGSNSELHILHLQLVDDTLIVGERGWGNVRALKVNLILFELISGLKVKFHKSLLVGVNFTESCTI
jgi:hypothetical protein